jgi:anaerobic selenocysteine-containing dehydrogenase
LTISLSDELPTIDHLRFLEDLVETPPFLRDGPDDSPDGHYSCAFCGVGDSGVVLTQPLAPPSAPAGPPAGEGILRVDGAGGTVEYPARLSDGGRLEIETGVPIAAPGAVVVGRLEIAGDVRAVVARATESPAGSEAQVFTVSAPAVSVSRSAIKDRVPTPGCVKLNVSMGQQQGAFPIHVAPSILDRVTGRRRSVPYDEAIAQLADLLLAHRPPAARTLLYACGQIDYFSIFSIQEVFRLLGVRNLSGNAEHCLNAGAVHNEILTGQEGPFLTIDQALDGPGRLHLLNGWNGLITHPPVFHRLLQRKDLDAYLVEVAVTESAQALAGKLGPERVLLVRAGSDPHFALAVAHEVLARYPRAVDEDFIARYADRQTFERYAALAGSERFAPERVAARIAPEPSIEERLLRGIRDIAAKLARPDVVPINIPSVGLSQTTGAVAHCLWGSLLALHGKYGLRGDGSPAGGTLRVPGQINAETEVQGLSRRCFMGRIPVTEAGAAEAARRMGLPDDAYAIALEDTPRPAIDYSDPAPEPELFLCFGTQFESNMMDRSRWVSKLRAPGTRLVVVDPIPDPFTLEHADLIIPSPPHAAAAKLYQNGEWRLTLSIPLKRAPWQTRTDATIVYDVRAEISRRLRDVAALRAAHPDLARHVESGYLAKRFEPPERGGGLRRLEGEVSRPQLWARILSYMEGGVGPLYCRPEHGDGRPITWEELRRAGTIVYGGVGTTRYRLDYDDPDHVPFRDVFRRPRKFTFFTPTEQDLDLPEGVILNSGRSSLSDDRTTVRFATTTFNSGKATPVVDMPEENPLHVSLSLAQRLGLQTGDRARVRNVETGGSLVIPVVVTDRVKGEATYVSFHKCRAEVEQGRYLNTLTSHLGRCPYTSQSNFKATRVEIEREPTGQVSAAAGQILAEARP